MENQCPSCNRIIGQFEKKHYVVVDGVQREVCCECAEKYQNGEDLKIETISNDTQNFSHINSDVNVGFSRIVLLLYGIASAILLIGFIAGFVLMTDYETESAFVIWGASVISCSLFFALGKIIDLLQEISDKM